MQAMPIIVEADRRCHHAPGDAQMGRLFPDDAKGWSRQLTVAMKTGYNASISQFPGFWSGTLGRSHRFRRLEVVERDPCCGASLRGLAHPTRGRTFLQWLNKAPRARSKSSLPKDRRRVASRSVGAQVSRRPFH